LALAVGFLAVCCWLLRLLGCGWWRQGGHAGQAATGGHLQAALLERRVVGGTIELIAFISPKVSGSDQGKQTILMAFAQTEQHRRAWFDLGPSVNGKANKTMKNRTSKMRPRPMRRS
jgi:hypothetical protein